MRNGLIVKRGENYLARGRTKSAWTDESGKCWSREIQAARVFTDHDRACREARRCGGTVRIMKDGRVEK